MTFKFCGPSWFLGALCAGIYYGHISPWLLLISPLFLIEYKPLVFKLWPRSD